MKHELRIPNLGLVESVTIVGWSKDSGETVQAGEVVVTVETEKAEVEVEAPIGGTLEILVHAGPDLVDADRVIALIDDGDPS